MSAQKSCLSETILLRAQNMCYGLVKGKMILHYTLLSGGLVDVYSNCLEVL